MKNYLYLENYCQNGDLGINKNVFKAVAEHCLTKEIDFQENKKKFEDVDVSIKENHVFYKIHAKAAEKVNKEELQKKVESVIYTNFKLLCDADEKSVDIKLVFDIK